MLCITLTACLSYRVTFMWNPSTVFWNVMLDLGIHYCKHKMCQKWWKCVTQKDIVEQFHYSLFVKNFNSDLIMKGKCILVRENIEGYVFSFNMYLNFTTESSWTKKAGLTLLYAMLLIEQSGKSYQKHKILWWVQKYLQTWHWASMTWPQIQGGKGYNCTWKHEIWLSKLSMIIWDTLVEGLKEEIHKKK